MSTWRRCRARYNWSYIENYSPGSGLGQTRGTVGHAALAFWYGNRDVYETPEDLDEATMKLAADMYTKAEINMDQSLEEDWQLMQVILPRYFDWARANDNFRKIISLEQKFEFTVEGIPVIGYIDGVVQVGDSIWLLEHKFNKQVSMNHIDLDPQMSIYLLAAYKAGIEARGVLFNVIRVAEGGIAQKEPVVRRQVYRNIEGLAVVEQEMALQLKEMKDFHENGGVIYRNPTKDCSWDCSFYNVCLSVNDNGDAQSVLRTIPIKPPVVEQEKGEEI